MQTAHIETSLFLGLLGHSLRLVSLELGTHVAFVCSSFSESLVRLDFLFRLLNGTRSFGSVAGGDGREFTSDVGGEVLALAQVSSTLTNSPFEKEGDETREAEVG